MKPDFGTCPFRELYVYGKSRLTKSFLRTQICFTYIVTIITSKSTNKSVCVHACVCVCARVREREREMLTKFPYRGHIIGPAYMDAGTCLHIYQTVSKAVRIRKE